MTQEQELLQSQDETQVDQLARYLQGVPWREWIFRVFLFVAAAAIIIAMVVASVLTVRAPSNGDSKRMDANPVVTMVEIPPGN